MTNNEILNPGDCIDADDLFTGCGGDVEYRIPMSPTGFSYPRCERHMEARWEKQQEISHRYGVPLTYYGNDRDGWDDDWNDY